MSEVATIEPDVVTHITGFVLIFLMLFMAACLLLSFASPNLDLVSACSAVVATLANIGPGLGMVGPTENYSVISSVGKVVLIFTMLLGRLELYTVLIIFMPGFWKK